MVEQFQIFLRKPGEEPVPIDVNPTDTIQDIKSRHNMSNAKLFVGRKFLKNASTLQEKGVVAGMTLNLSVMKIARLVIAQLAFSYLTSNTME